MSSAGGLLRAILLLMALDACIMVFLAVSRGWLVLGFALCGLAYTGFLKRYALGE